MPRPSRITSTPNTGRLWSILAGLGGGDSGVALTDPEAEDKELVGMLGDNADTSKDSNTLSVRPTAVPTHWWNKGKANDINNQLIMSDYSSNTATANAIKQALAIKAGSIPLDAQATTATGEAETGVQKNRLEALRSGIRQNANDQTTHNAGLMVNDNNNRMLENQTTIPILNELLSRSNLATDKNQAESQDVGMANQIKSNRFPLELDDVAKAFKDKQAVEDAKLAQTKAETKRAGFMSTMPGAEVVDLNQPSSVYQNPLKPISITDQIKEGLIRSDPTFSNLLKPANSTIGKTNITGALPRLQTTPTTGKVVDYAKDQYGVKDPSGKTQLMGSVIDGVFIPYGKQKQ